MPDDTEETLAVALQDQRVFGRTKALRGLDDGVHDGPQVVGRAADDVENVAGRSLIFERFRKLAGAGLHFFEQMDVADGDDGLVGESFQQADLLVAERM